MEICIESQNKSQNKFRIKEMHHNEYTDYQYTNGSHLKKIHDNNNYNLYWDWTNLCFFLDESIQQVFKIIISWNNQLNKM